MTQPRRMADLPPAQQAGILCNDAGFQKYAALRCNITAPRLSPSATAEWLRRECKINSRRDLNTDPKARAAFDTLRTNFDAWRGKIAAPR